MRKFADYDILIGKSEDFGLKWPLYFNYKKILKREKYGFRQNPYTNYVLESNGVESIKNICRIAKIDDINTEITRFELPYENLSDFVQDFFELSLQNWMIGSIDDHNSILTITAPIKIFFENLSLTSQKLTVEIKAYLPKKPREIRIRTIDHKYSGQTQRVSYLIKTDQWKKYTNCYSFVHDYKITDSRYVKISLTYKNETIDEITVENPELHAENIRAALHSSIDPSFKNLKNYIYSMGKNPQKDFETGITWLLHICGLNVVDYGTNELTREFVDILAFVPGSDKIFMIECTTHLPNVKNKLAKLHQRVKKLQKLFPKNTLIPIMVTSLPIDEIPTTDFQNAQSLGINIIANKEIDLLLKVSSRRYPLDLTVNILLTSIWLK